VLLPGDEDCNLKAALTQAAELQRVLREHDVPALVRLANADDSLVRVVAERGAVQIVNCSGAAVANFPLAGDLMNAVTQ
jgi:hypothetical protein